SNHRNPRLILKIFFISSRARRMSMRSVPSWTMSVILISSPPREQKIEDRLNLLGDAKKTQERVNSEVRKILPSFPKEPTSRNIEDVNFVNGGKISPTDSESSPPPVSKQKSGTLKSDGSSLKDPKKPVSGNRTRQP